MRAAKCVRNDEPGEEDPQFGRPVGFPPSCLAVLAEPWLRDHYYRREDMHEMRIRVYAMCAATGHRKCAVAIWLDGLPPGADRYAWDGTQPEEKP